MRSHRPPAAATAGKSPSRTPRARHETGARVERASVLFASRCGGKHVDPTAQWHCVACIGTT
eukprot:10095177-Lingulodinium_polyedra.AAC.1